MMTKTNVKYVRLTAQNGEKEKAAVFSYDTEERLKNLQMGIIQSGFKVIKTDLIDVHTYYNEMLKFTYDGFLEAVASFILSDDMKVVVSCIMLMDMAPNIMKETIKEVQDLKLDIEITECYRQLAQGKLDMLRAYEVVMKRL